MLDFFKNYFILFLLALFSISLIYFFYLKKYNKNITPQKIIIEPFIPSTEFSGEKKGYVFKNDDMGIGYYKDN